MKKAALKNLIAIVLLFASINQSIPYNFLSLDHHLIAQLNVDMDYETESENEKKRKVKKNRRIKKKVPCSFPCVHTEQKECEYFICFIRLFLKDRSRTIFLPPPEHLF